MCVSVCVVIFYKSFADLISKANGGCDRLGLAGEVTDVGGDVRRGEGVHDCF